MLKNKSIAKVMFGFGCLCILAGVFNTLKGNVSSGTVVIITGLALIILSQFEIESLKLLGLEAKLKGTITEAEEVLSKLKSISVPISQLAVSVAVRAGRWDSDTPAGEMYQYVKELEGKLSNMGVSKDDIIKVKKDWVTFTALDLSRDLINKIINPLHEKIQVERAKNDSLIDKERQTSPEKMPVINQHLNKLQNEMDRLRALATIYTVHSFPEGIDDFFKNTEIMSDDEKRRFLSDEKETLEDIKLLLKEGKIRRPHMLSTGT
ncbi:hypothetical protein BZ160_00360 [Pantoea vagans]|nr:hypothetical protein [Pantoea vagans]OQV42616.1 hypothetical protein BZ160_00360 [Pantoea vagans]